MDGSEADGEWSEGTNDSDSDESKCPDHGGTWQNLAEHSVLDHLGKA